MDWKSQHPTSQFRDDAQGVQSPKILQQHEGPFQSAWLWLFEPSESIDINDPGGFQGQHDFGQIHTPHFGQFLCGALSVIVLGP